MGRKVGGRSALERSAREILMFWGAFLAENGAQRADFGAHGNPTGDPKS